MLRPAKAVIAAVLARSGYEPRHYALFDVWDRLLGPQAAKARAVGVKNGRLYVDVDSSVRLHTLTLRKRELVKKMNGAFGQDAPLSDIIFRLGTTPFSDDTNA